MKNKKQKISSSVETEPAEAKARVPFFAQKLEPQSLRSIRGGDDLQAMEAAAKAAGG